MKKSCILALALLSLAACHNEEKQAPADFLAQDLDTTVSPGADFFQYANGGWIKSTTIPAAESGWGVGNLVQEDIYQRLRTISEKAATDTATAGSVTRQIGDLWTSGMDSAAIDKQALSPLQPELDSIRAVRNIPGLLQEAALLQEKGVSCLFSDYVGQDDKNSSQMAFQLGQGGLGLPNRDYYFKTDAKSTMVRTAYQQYLFLTFRQLGADSVTATQKSHRRICTGNQACRRLPPTRRPSQSQ